MNRKQQIEKTILKELHDREIMKKIRRINEARSLKGIVSQIEKQGGSVNPTEVQSRRAARNVLNSMGWNWGQDSSTVDDLPDAGSTAESDRIDDAAARARLEAESKPQKEPASAEKAQRIEDEIKKHLDQLVVANSKLTHANVVGKGVKTKGVMTGEELSQHLSGIDASHPHLSNVTSSLRKLLGLGVN
jgi:hypothetical protein